MQQGARCGISGWWLPEVAGRSPDGDAGAQGLPIVWLRDRSGLEWLRRVLLASVEVGGGVPVPVVTGMPPAMPRPGVAVVRMMVVTVIPLRGVMIIPSVRTVGMIVAVMPSRVVSIVVAAAIIVPTVGADRGIAAAAGDEERQAAEE
jgi:hypothetical protein